MLYVGVGVGHTVYNPNGVFQQSNYTGTVNLTGYTVYVT